ncbi:MAG: DUF433 domain-containing protein [Pseudanabaenales cyanobacterium]|nr:DUF433 domain-containing protein [Pseudanabaenales cyanobacterium]
MTTEELKAQLLALTPEEKSQVIRLLVQSLANSWDGINKTPGVMGGDACIRSTRIPVWLLINYRRMGKSEADILDAYTDLSATDLANAWAYAEAFPEEIEVALQEQEEADKLLEPSV